jgi:hypothetical protein
MYVSKVLLLSFSPARLHGGRMLDRGIGILLLSWYGCEWPGSLFPTMCVKGSCLCIPHLNNVHLTLVSSSQASQRPTASGSEGLLHAAGTFFSSLSPSPTPQTAGSTQYGRNHASRSGGNIPVSSMSADFQQVPSYPGQVSSIPMSYCIPPPPPDFGIAFRNRNPYMGLAESSIPVRHLREDCHTRRPSAVLLWSYFTCYPTSAG